MSKRIFSGEQMKELLANENIAKCSDKSITYENDFKIRAIKQYNEDGLTSSKIFRQAGFDLDLIGRETAKDCLKRWNKMYRTKGVEGLADSRGTAKGGGRPKMKNLTSADKIKRLEAEVAYLKAENDFLAKLRARRRK